MIRSSSRSFHSTCADRRGRPVGRTFSGAVQRCAALALSAAGIATAAAAQDNNVYLAVIRDDVKPIVIYVFSDPNVNGFAPIDATAYYAEPEYRPAGGVFDPTQGCTFTLDYTGDIPEQFKAAPIYGPASSQRSINFVDLPSFMAREAVKALLEGGMLADEAQAGPYFNCAGYVWSRLMNQPPGVFEELIRQEAERIRSNR